MLYTYDIYFQTSNLKIVRSYFQLIYFFKINNVQSAAAKKLQFTATLAVGGLSALGNVQLEQNKYIIKMVKYISLYNTQDVHDQIDLYQFGNIKL